MKSTAILIATKNGENVIGSTVQHAIPQADVYVVSDGSTDETAHAARQAGAHVLELEVNVGKPAALRTGFVHFDLNRYHYVLVVDDDTRLAFDFVEQAEAAFDFDVVAVAGWTRGDITEANRWNGWVHARAWAYWTYGVLFKRGQSALRVVTVLPGSNTMFRAGVLAELIQREVRYIVDDTQWLLDIQTEKMGRVAYQPRAVAYVQDPLTIRPYYKQFVRWMHGTFQGIRGHGILKPVGWFRLTYIATILDWLLYVLFWPALLFFIGYHAIRDGRQTASLFGAVYLGGYMLLGLIAAIVLRQWRTFIMFPYFIAMDWVNRIVFIHAFFKALRQPTSECKWDSPQRVSTRKETQ
jgi:cellulose synthase/poly-beta-1,6-N-acetylglucosamine synthase-like glycosyltransferase